MSWWRHETERQPENIVFISHSTWWRHQMETFPALLALCAGNSPVISGFASNRPVTWSFDVFVDLLHNKRFGHNRDAPETPSRSSRRYCKAQVTLCRSFLPMFPIIADSPDLSWSWQNHQIVALIPDLCLSKTASTILVRQLYDTCTTEVFCPLFVRFPRPSVRPLIRSTRLHSRF